MVLTEMKITWLVGWLAGWMDPVSEWVSDNQSRSVTDTIKIFLKWVNLNNFFHKTIQTDTTMRVSASTSACLYTYSNQIHENKNKKSYRKYSSFLNWNYFEFIRNGAAVVFRTTLERVRKELFGFGSLSSLQSVLMFWISCSEIGNKLLKCEKEVFLSEMC